MKKTFKTIALATITLGAAAILSACDQANTCKYDEANNTLSCSEKTYKTANLGGKVWMAENIAAYIPDSSVCYGNEHVTCETTGRLYTWSAAMTGLCPKGWTLPSQEDFFDRRVQTRQGRDLYDQGIQPRYRPSPGRGGNRLEYGRVPRPLRQGQGRYRVLRLEGCRTLHLSDRGGQGI